MGGIVSAQTVQRIGLQSLHCFSVAGLDKMLKKKRPAEGRPAHELNWPHTALSTTVMCLQVTLPVTLFARLQLPALVFQSQLSKAGKLCGRCASLQSGLEQFSKRHLCMSAAAAQESFSLTTTAADRYDEQLAAKVVSVRQCFSGVQLPPVEIVESAQQHYRMRAEFSVWRDKEDLYYIMYDNVAQVGHHAGCTAVLLVLLVPVLCVPSLQLCNWCSKDTHTCLQVHLARIARQESASAARTRVRVDQFPVGSRLMNVLMAEVITVAKADRELRHKLFQA